MFFGIEELKLGMPHYEAADILESFIEDNYFYDKEWRTYPDKAECRFDVGSKVFVLVFSTTGDRFVWPLIDGYIHHNL